MNDDVINRQEAIDVLRVGEELLSRVLEDTEVVGNVRDKYEWGRELLKSCISDIEDLPSVQPEIIRCKDCKHYKAHEYTGKLACHYVIGGTVVRNLNDFCSRAERITDSNDRD